MARKRMVTRTVKSTLVNALCADLVNGELCNLDIELAGVYADNKALKKALETHIDKEDELKVVQVISTEEIETLYGMDEQKFIENAEKLPPRTVDENADETEDNE